MSKSATKKWPGKVTEYTSDQGAINEHAHRLCSCFLKYQSPLLSALPGAVAIFDARAKAVWVSDKTRAMFAVAERQLLGNGLISMFDNKACFTIRAAVSDTILSGEEMKEQLHFKQFEGAVTNSSRTVGVSFSLLPSCMTHRKGPFVIAVFRFLTGLEEQVENLRTEDRSCGSAVQSTAVHVGDVLRSICTGFDKRPGGLRKRIEIREQEELPAINTNPDVLKRAISNLVSMAELLSSSSENIRFPIGRSARYISLGAEFTSDFEEMAASPEFSDLQGQMTFIGGRLRAKELPGRQLRILIELPINAGARGAEPQLMENTIFRFSSKTSQNLNANYIPKRQIAG